MFLSLVTESAESIISFIAVKVKMVCNTNFHILSFIQVRSQFSERSCVAVSIFYILDVSNDMFPIIWMWPFFLL